MVGLVDSWCFCNGGGKSEKMKATIFSGKGPAMAHIAVNGTGFLIHRNLLLTTHVVLPSVAAAEAAEIRLQNGVAARLFPHSEAGGFGTILKPFRQALDLSPLTWKMVVENEKHIKLALVVVGGLSDLGFVQKDRAACTTICTIEYEVKEEAVANVSFVSIQSFVAIMPVVPMRRMQCSS